MKRTTLFTKKALLPILAVSLSQIARAATFNSVQTGDWSDPLSWDDGILTPDTYDSDNAVINGGHIINYNDVGAGLGPMSTPAGIVPLAGGLCHCERELGPH